MPNTKSTLPAIILIFAAALSHAQTPATKYSFPQVGWTMFLPASFKVVDSAKQAALNEKGKKEMHDATNIQADLSQLKTLISATKNANNYFNSTITPYDPKKDGPYAKANQAVKSVLYSTFKQQIPTAKIDTVSSQLAIDGVTFDRFYVRLTLGAKMMLHMIILSKFYKGYDFGITYLYSDEESKTEIESILKTSKFTSRPAGNAP
jgi:hypothetical protein